MMAKNQKSTTDVGENVPGNADEGRSSAETEGAHAASAPQSRVLARVLARCYLGEPDDVVEIDGELVASMSDLVDAAPAAVEYAQSLKA